MADIRPASKFACRKCGYDLRQTALGANCPECGTPVLAVNKGYRAEDGMLIVSDGGVLPARCIKTNAPTEQAAKSETLYYISPWVYLLLFTGLIPLLIVYLIFRKKVTVTYCLSSQARKWIWIKGAIAASLWILFTFGCCIGTSTDKPAVFIISGLIGVGAFIWMLAIFNNQISIKKKIGENEYALGGVCKEFIDQVQAENDGD